jgi:hypothetical protein
MEIFDNELSTPINPKGTIVVVGLQRKCGEVAPWFTNIRSEKRRSCVENAGLESGWEIADVEFLNISGDAVMKFICGAFFRLNEATTGWSALSRCARWS